jgi:Arc/MetJ-type ribon-helix-helix transcriptional regulator
VKLSVSMNDDDVAFLDQYAAEHDVGSRSAVLHKAVALLRASELSDDYAAAWTEWSLSDEAALWDATATDGIEA